MKNIGAKIKYLLRLHLVLLLVASCLAQAAADDADFTVPWRYATALNLEPVMVSLPVFERESEFINLRLDNDLKQPGTEHEESGQAGNATVYMLSAVIALVLAYTLIDYLFSIGRLSAAAIYVSVKVKFIIAFTLAIIWTALSIYLARYWYDDLSGHIGAGLAALLILGIAIIPGFMNAFLLSSLIMDRRPERVKVTEYPPLTILIAAYNEAASIAKTIHSIELQHYPAALEVIVIDDGSSDATVDVVNKEMARYPWLELIHQKENGGKARALNQGLAVASHGLIVTLDADSCLHQDALQKIVERFFGDPLNTRAVAGTVLVQNSRASWIAGAQEWEYFHGISAMKRVQSLFQGTLVAQGAFSLYEKQTLIEVGGWPDCVGEDIVLTWALLNRGYRVGHSEDACVFTSVPTTLKQFMRQRRRWSRGMIEAFKKHPGILFTPRLTTFFIYWDLLLPLLDFVFTVFFIPGLMLALVGYFWIVGPMTLTLLPIGMAMNYTMYFFGKKMFDKGRLHVRANMEGFLIYAIGYNLILQPVCLLGYVSEFINLKRSWGTK